jgi:hypothetical protein
MSEVGDGFYKYDFTSYSGTVNYAIRCDGGPTISGSERYTYSTNDNFIEDIEDAVWNAQLSNHQVSGSFGAELISLIKQNRQYNIYFEEVRATSDIASRKVASGQVSHIIFKLKKEEDSDWTSPVASGTLFAWYKTIGDISPQYMREDA